MNMEKLQDRRVLIIGATAGLLIGAGIGAAIVASRTRTWERSVDQMANQVTDITERINSQVADLSDRLGDFVSNLTERSSRVQERFTRR
jgi:hypothetical protein